MEPPHVLIPTDCYSRQVVKVLAAAPRPDGDPVDLVVQPVQEEAQELLSVLLAVKETRLAQHIHTLFLISLTAAYL